MGYYDPERMIMKTGYKILISVGAGLFCFIFSMFSQVLLMPFLTLGAFLAAVWSPVYMLPAVAGAAAGILVFPSALTAGSFVTLGMYVILPVFIALCLGKKLPHRYAVLGSAVVLTVGMYLSMTVDSLIAGEAPYAGAVAVWNENMLSPLREALGSDPIYSSFLEGLADFESYIPDVIMPSCLASGCGTAFAVVLLTRLFYKLFRIEPARPMAQFKDWKLPQTAHWGCLIIAAVIPVAYIFRFERANAIAVSVAIIVLGLFSLQGLAYLTFVFAETGAPGGLRAMLFLFAAVLFPYSSVALTVFGLREQIKNDRRLMRKLRESDDRMKKARQRSDEINKYGYSRDEKPDDKDDEN